MRFLPYRGVGRFKGFLFVSAVVITLILFWHTQEIISGLRHEARDILLFYAKFYASAINEEDSSSLDFIFENVIKGTNFPLILADQQGRPNYWKGIEVSPDSTYSPRALKEVEEIMRVMKKEIDPIPLTYVHPASGDTVTIGYLVYGDSKRIKQLQRLPYIEIGVVGLFILVGFFGFNSIRRGEQQFIWVGMAKETAHQLGTPISSLMRWLELLRSQAKDPAAQQTIDEMNGDVDRLNRIAARFSQIGSNTELKEQNVVHLAGEVVRYFRVRLPQMGRAINIQIQSSAVPNVLLNRHLFEWVLENLIKNALDAINTRNGEILIDINPAHEKRYKIAIDISDNGKGIDPANRKNVFRPGYSTKKRGWGLGLSLAKRIVEDYHKGRLTLKESRPGEGTTMRILI